MGICSLNLGSFLFFLRTRITIRLPYRTLVTFSVPFISTFYFLQTDESGGVRFGLWGWCLTNGTLCSPKAWVTINRLSCPNVETELLLPIHRLGIDWKPQLIFWLTQALALYPVCESYSFFFSFVLAILRFLCSCTGASWLGFQTSLRILRSPLLFQLSTLLYERQRKHDINRILPKRFHAWWEYQNAHLYCDFTWNLSSSAFISRGIIVLTLLSSLSIRWV